MRPAWSVASAFIGYSSTAFTPRRPSAFCRRQWSSTGIRNDSVLPDPVPVVASVGSAAPLYVLSRSHAFAWCRHGVNGGCHSSAACPPVVGRMERRPDPQIRPPEDARFRDLEEPLQGEPRVLVGQGGLHEGLSGRAADGTAGCTAP
jgi:hypothetical protein